MGEKKQSSTCLEEKGPDDFVFVVEGGSGWEPTAKMVGLGCPYYAPGFTWGAMENVLLAQFGTELGSALALCQTWLVIGKLWLYSDWCSFRICGTFGMKPVSWL